MAPFQQTVRRGAARALAWGLVAGLAACSGSGPGADMSAPDMTVVDLRPAGPSCGEIVLCVITCGLGQASCDAQCAAGASPTEAIKAGSLAVCATLHCASSDGGTGLPALFTCLATSCQKEIAGCDGLPF